MSKLKEECSCDKCMKGIRYSIDELRFFILRETPTSVRERVGVSWRRDVIELEEEHRDLHDRHTYFEWNSTRGIFTCRICGLN
jgi:dynactin complex subunit